MQVFFIFYKNRGVFYNSSFKRLYFLAFSVPRVVFSHGAILVSEYGAVRQWRKSDRPASPFLTVPDPATANQNQNRLARDVS